jgi:hypothetical protein
MNRYTCTHCGSTLTTRAIVAGWDCTACKTHNRTNGNAETPPLEIQHFIENVLLFRKRWWGDEQPTMVETREAMQEEWHEFIEACESSTSEHAAQECADLLYTAIGHWCSSFPLSDRNELIAGLLKVMQKNNAKTALTHELNNAGKVVRK